MKTYAEKLRDPRWKRFRLDYIESKSTEEGDSECDDCGNETQGTLHVHHKVYRNGLEPWEYDFSDLRLICHECHDRLHEAEQRARALVLTLRPHECYELDDFLEEFKEAIAEGHAKIALARCKNEIRDVLRTFGSSR